MTSTTEIVDLFVSLALFCLFCSWLQSQAEISKIKSLGVVLKSPKQKHFSVHFSSGGSKLQMAAQAITSWLATPTIESGILQWKIWTFFHLSIAHSTCYSDFGNA